jgi:glycosyltransferase involved in cell wall biosynthesis
VLTGQACFHGWRSREEYWQVMARWDAVVFFSDNEGGPIGLLEGMAAGALPFYPQRSGSWADVHAPQVDPLCHYPPGDMPALAAAVRRIFQRSPEQLARLREISRSLVQAHTAKEYGATCLDFFARMSAMPRISQERKRVGRLSDLLPLGIATRLAPSLLTRC